MYQDLSGWKHSTAALPDYSESQLLDVETKVGPYCFLLLFNSSAQTTTGDEPDLVGLTDWLKS